MPEEILQGLGPDELPQPSRQVAEPGVVTTDLGKIVPTLEGPYDPAKVYIYPAIVHYGGCTYGTRKPVVGPGVAPSDGEDWMLLVDAGGAMPKTGGTFTGDVVAYSGNRATAGLRNIEVRETDENGALQSTNKIIMVRE